MSHFAITINSVFSEGGRSIPATFVDAKTGNLLEATMIVEAKDQQALRLTAEFQAAENSYKSPGVMASSYTVEGPLDVKPVRLDPLAKYVTAEMDTLNLNASERAHVAVGFKQYTGGGTL